MSDKATVTHVVPVPGLSVGDYINIVDARPWWLKVWHWIIRKKYNGVFQITSVTETTFTYDIKAKP